MFCTYFLHVAAARSSRGGVTASYVLPVLWMTSRFSAVGLVGIFLRHGVVFVYNDGLSCGAERYALSNRGHVADQLSRVSIVRAAHNQLATPDHCSSMQAVVSLTNANNCVSRPACFEPLEERPPHFISSHLK